MENQAVTTRARVYMNPAFWTSKGLKNVTIVRCSIWVVFLAFLTVMVVQWSGYCGGFESGKTVYRVNISTGTISVEGAQVVGRN